MKIYNPFKAIKLFFAKRLQQKIEKKVLIHQTEKYLENLIKDYRLIMKKESDLSASRRKQVVEEVEKYIESGHITPN